MKNQPQPNKMRGAAHRIWRHAILLLLGVCLWPIPPATGQQPVTSDRICPYERNPRYWQYKSQPVLLLGD